MRDFKKLDVWKKAHALTLAIYQQTANFPADERFGLTSQIRRAAASIGANIAEGCGRSTDGDFGRFLDIASGSACEVEYHLILARDLTLLADEAHEPLDSSINEVKRMLVGLCRSLRTNN